MKMDVGKKKVSQTAAEAGMPGEREKQKPQIIISDWQLAITRKPKYALKTLLKMVNFVKCLTQLRGFTHGPRARTCSRMLGNVDVFMLSLTQNII